MINQLRIYEIFEPTRQEFLDRFKNHAARIMTDHGFEIVAMWETRHNEKPAFAYLMAWSDEAHMKRAWAAFMADPEWAAIKAARDPDGGPIVGEIVDLPLAPCAFSRDLRAPDVS
ncbi:MAG: NIPSNAP family protein [Pseudomonadota bacterium]